MSLYLVPRRRPTPFRSNPRTKYKVLHQSRKPQNALHLNLSEATALACWHRPSTEQGRFIVVSEFYCTVFWGWRVFFGKVWPNLFFGRFGQALFQFDSASYWGSDPSQKKQIPKLLPDPFPKGLLQIKTPKIAISPIACCKHTTLEMWVC